VRLDRRAFTIGYARRAAEYKRASLVFTDLERLRRIAESMGPTQLVFAGKAHPRDEGGKREIRAVFEASARLGNAVPVVYLADYDMNLSRLLAAGCDLWLNTPRRPEEASGTSGMKAALNGVPSLSVLDGWWVEGHVEGVTGWSIDGEAAGGEASSLYEKLGGAILPMFFGSPDRYALVMRSAIALNGSFFNAERMVFQYAENAYGL
jgi:starch phosphorylase